MVKEAVTERLRQVLAGEKHVRFAVLYGSAVEAGEEGERIDSPFRDLDVAIWLDEELLGPRTSLAWAARVEAALQRAVDHPVDLRILNGAPLPFRYNVSRGNPLLINDKEAWYHFLERTWDEYLDFQPVATAYLREMQ